MTVDLNKHDHRIKLSYQCPVTQKTSTITFNDVLVNVLPVSNNGRYGSFPDASADMSWRCNHCNENHRIVLREVHYNDY